jgi:hypothetical protein
MYFILLNKVAKSRRISGGFLLGADSFKRPEEKLFPHMDRMGGGTGRMDEMPCARSRRALCW